MLTPCRVIMGHLHYPKYSSLSIEVVNGFYCMASQFLKYRKYHRLEHFYKVGCPTQNCQTKLWLFLFLNTKWPTVCDNFSTSYEQHKSIILYPHLKSTNWNVQSIIIHLPPFSHFLFFWNNVYVVLCGELGVINQWSQWGDPLTLIGLNSNPQCTHTHMHS